MPDPITYFPIMILDHSNVHHDSDLLIDICTSVRQLLAASMSYYDKCDPTNIWHIMNQEEDLAYKVFDL